MLCPINGNKDFDEETCISCGFYSQCLSKSNFNNQGDNFPELPTESFYNAVEQEIIESISKIGNNYTWELIESFTDVKLRLQYRNAFLKLGGTIPEREDDDKFN